MPRLTEANYQSRRIKLTEQIAAASRAYIDAAYRAEIGEADADADLRKHREARADFEARLDGLNNAWERAKATIQEELDERQAGDRQNAAEALVSILDKRMGAAKDMDLAVADLIAAWRDKRSLENQAMTLLQHALSLPGAASYDAATTALPLVNIAMRHDWAGKGIGGMLAAAGFDFSDHDWNTASYVNGGDKPLEHYCEASNQAALAHISRIVPDVWKLTHSERETAEMEDTFLNKAGTIVIYNETPDQT